MIVIIDIDNTLCLNNKRFELAKKENGKTDWDIAHNPELVEQDEPNFPMIDLAHKYKRDGLKIIIITGRPESIREVTELWLLKYHIVYNALYMRTERDHYIKADILKRKIYETYIKEKVFCAYDDDQRIIDMWVSLGIPSFKVIGIQ
jgi:hydroxymethylpyrimidine pyrophosphatase-like HAD family hydrolase